MKKCENVFFIEAYSEPLILKNRSATYNFFFDPAIEYLYTGEVIKNVK